METSTTMKRLAAAAGAVVALAAGAFVANETLLAGCTPQTSTLAVGQTFQSAYASSSCKGDVFELAPGAHPAQTMSYVTSKGEVGDAADVTFRGQPGATVGPITGYGVRFVTFEALDVQGAVIFECEDSGVPTEARGQHPVGVTVRNSRIRGTTRSENAQRLVIEDNEIGPSSAVIKVGASADDLGANCTDEPPSDITFVGNDIHNFREASAASHMECVFVEGVQGLVIRRNIVRGCSVFSIFFKQQLAAGLFGMQDILIENNFLGCPVASAFRSAGTTSMSFSEGNYTNLTVRNNSICGNLLFRKDLPGTWTNVVAEGNLGKQISTGSPSVSVCTAAGVTVRDNAWTAASKCPADLASGVVTGWIDVETSEEINSSTSDPTIDYHLAAGAWAIDKAPSGPSQDFDQQARPSGSSYDVGADEAGATEPPPTTTEPLPTTTEPPLTTTEPSVPTDLAIFCSEYVPNAQAESSYAKWLTQNPGEKSRWEPYRDGVCAGGNPSPPAMLTAKGRGLVAAGKMTR